MKRKNKILSVILSIAFVIAMIPVSGMSEVYADGEDAPEIATWEGWRKAAATFTFDDGAPSHYEYAAPLFDNYGYKASFYLVTKWNPDWTKFQELAKNGHEIGSHSDTHPNNMSGEEASSKNYILEKINTEDEKYTDCITVAYPNLNVPDVDAVRSNYIAGRIGNGSWAGEQDINSKNGPRDWCKVSALMTGVNGTVKTAENFTSKFQDAIEINGWVVFLTHGFSGKSNGSATYSPTDINAIDGALKWAKDNDSQIWITTMCNAAMYIKERNASKFVKTTSTDSSITYTLTHKIADTVCEYQYPLSVRVPAPEGWEEIKVTQKDADLKYEIKDGKIYFQAIPNGGDIVISKKITEPDTTEPDTTEPDTSVKTEEGTTEKSTVTEEKTTENRTTEAPAEQPGASQSKTKEGIGTISTDGKILTDEAGIEYYVVEKMTNQQLKKNTLVADKKSGGKFKITKITKKNGKVVSGNVSYMAPYNKNCTKATAPDFVKIAGVKFKVTEINKNAFKNCKKIKSITFGKNITKIGANAFSGCAKLKTITIRTTVLKSIGSKAFSGINSKAKFKVPKKQIKKYTKMIKKAKAPKNANFIF